jgi:hypothetical protein
VALVYHIFERWNYIAINLCRHFVHLVEQLLTILDTIAIRGISKSIKIIILFKHAESIFYWRWNWFIQK